ncbi:MAG: ribonuclease III [bacterium]|nr:ribonuclease III [bacterium]
MLCSDLLSLRQLQELQDNIGYHFVDVALLEKALTHKSYANENHLENTFGNERFEFLGDAVLELAVSHILMQRFEQFHEGQLSKMRAAIVNKHELARLAVSFDIGSYILLSRGEHESSGRDKASILSNVYEAIVAAVYYDGGFGSAFTMIDNHFLDLIDEVAENGFVKDYKSRLQEYAQKTFSEVPVYIVLKEQGPDHYKMFEIQVTINEDVYSTGCGRNKKAAEQDAAQKTLKMLTGEEI